MSNLILEQVYYSAEDEDKGSSDKLKKDVPQKNASYTTLEKRSKPASGGGRNDSTKYYTDNELRRGQET